MLDGLWRHTRAAYLDNPLPPAVKERLLAYLSRYCSVPYGVVCHSCALRPLGFTGRRILDLLQSPPPDEHEIALLTHLLFDAEERDHWPPAGSPLDRALFLAAVAVFLRAGGVRTTSLALRRVLGDRQYPNLIAFLGYIRACHVWIESHPDLDYHADQRAIEHLEPLITEEPGLKEFFNSYRETVSHEAGMVAERLRSDLDRHALVEDVLKRWTGELERQVADRTRELERSREALRESEERFRKIFEEGPLGMAVVGLDNRVQQVNATFCRLTGYSEAELVGRSFAAITHPDDVDIDVDLARRVFAGEIPFYRLEKRYIRKDGGVVWVNLTATVVRNPDGSAAFGLGMVEDISDRKAPEPPACEWMGSGVIVLADPHAAVRRVTRAMLEQLGFTVVEAHDPDEAIGLVRAHASDLACVLLDTAVSNVVPELRRARPGVKVVMTGGSAMPERRDTGARPSAVFLPKPYRIETLRRVLRAVLTSATS